MKKLLYIGHDYHNKTKSTLFLQELLKQKYEVTKFNFDPYNDTSEKYKVLNNQYFDVVVIFQMMPEIELIKKNVKFSFIAFFPMYDGAPKFSDSIWYQYRDCNIINFSKTLHDECKAYGFSSFYIQYFPKPKEISDLGDEESVFLWQRINQINPETVDKVIGFENINRFFHHQVPDPCHDVMEVAEQWKHKVEISTWFDTKEQMEEHLQKSSIYFAPRHLEGIGMSFLDAMAMGRCVITPNNPTMNEYIKDGFNGFLYDLDHPAKIKLKNIREIQNNTLKYIENGYAKWNDEKYRIFEWIEADVTENRNDFLLRKKYSGCCLSWKIKKCTMYRAVRKVYRIVKKIVKWVIGRK